MKKIWFDLFDTVQCVNFRTSEKSSEVTENNGGPWRIRISDLYRVKVVHALSLQRAFRKWLIPLETVCSITVQPDWNRAVLFSEFARLNFPLPLPCTGGLA